MATYYVYSGAAGANNGTSWTDAYTSRTSALAAATTNGDIIKTHKTHTEILAADGTFTYGANIIDVVVDKDASDALAVMDGTTGYIGHTTTSYNITVNGARTVYMYGMAWKLASTLGRDLTLCQDGSHFEVENCSLYLNSNQFSNLVLGVSTAANSYVKLVNFTYNVAHSGQAILVQSADAEFYGINLTGTALSSLFAAGTGGSPGDIEVYNSDVSSITTNLAPNCGGAAQNFKFYNCKIPTGITYLATQTVGNLGGGTLYLYNCANGNTHYNFGHYNGFGQTESTVAIYANDGASYDGTNRCSWRITTTANCSYYTPYISPWFSKYNAVGSAISPSIEILRDGSTTAYNDNEVWGEWMYEGTTGSTQGTLVDDKMIPLGTPAAQANGAGLSNWTGEGGTAWSGKLAPASSFTPQEIGDVSARVCVGVASSTVYADPTMRI